jgi:sacsin
MQGFKWGQKEPLTARITKLLQSYPNFFDLFKELLQNADDAGASQIAFILDNRQHGCKKVFSKEFASLQGPALLCYNNQIFSEDDLVALKTLGVGNKGEEKFKIGKYGVGFNCTYRLTDVPQIISNLNNYVIFDPLCKHFPQLLDSNPGFRIPFNINDIDNPFYQYEDVIQIFQGDLKKIDQLANGTMFRFPLRKKASSIHDRVFSAHEVEHEIRNKSSEMKNAMIFLKNIRKLVFK